MILCWFDTEFTSGDGAIETAALLQAALIVTDHKLRPILPPHVDIPLEYRRQAGLSACLHYDGEAHPWVQENLGALLQEAKASQLTNGVLDEYMCAYLRACAEDAVKKPVEERPVLAGNSVHIDWFLLKKYLPKFGEYLGYRVLDVTAVKLEWHNYHHGVPFEKKTNDAMVESYFPVPELYESGAAHDAYFDIQASIAELAYYRGQLQRRPEPTAERVRS